MQNPHPPGTVGSVLQLSVCANRTANVCFPIDRGPLSSYPWATSPRTARSPSLASRRRCPITSRKSVRDSSARAASSAQQQGSSVGGQQSADGQHGSGQQGSLVSHLLSQRIDDLSN